MKVVILAGGFGTRLEKGLNDVPKAEQEKYSFLKGLHKAMIPIAGKPILQYQIESLVDVEEIGSIYILSNAKYYEQIKRFVLDFPSPKPIYILNDGATSNENRIGAVKDLEFTIKEGKLGSEHLLVMACDTLFYPDFSFNEFVNFFNEKDSTVITYYEENKDKLHRRGIIEIDEHGKVISFEEKPENPKTNLAVPPLYIFHKKDVPFLSGYMRTVQNADAPGNLIKFLHDKRAVFAFKISGRHDIGDAEDYIKTDKLFEGRE